MGKPKFYITHSASHRHDLLDDINNAVKRKVLTDLRKHISDIEFAPNPIEKEIAIQELCNSYYSKFDKALFEKHFFFTLNLEKDECYISESSILESILNFQHLVSDFFSPLPPEYGFEGHHMDSYQVCFLKTPEDVYKAYEVTIGSNLINEASSFIVYDYLNNYRKKMMLFQVETQQSKSSKIKIQSDTKKPSVPYQIAVLYELGFFDIPTIANMTKTNQYELLSRLLGSDPRTIKGNSSTMYRSSEENLSRYTAHIHQNSARKLIDSLSG